MIDTESLRKKVIDLAIRGKLTEQLPSDGDAETLYAQIQEEKDRLLKEGKIKRDKPLPDITDEEIPFEIPENWKWIRLGDYSQKVTDQVASGSFAALRENVPSLKEPDYAIMVKTADFANGFTSNLTYTDKHGYEFLSNSNLFGGELILSNIGSIGKCFIVPDLGCKMTLAPNSVMIRLVDEELRDYLYYFILSRQGFLELDSISTGIAVKKFNKTDLKTIIIPVPPVAEQQRIVSKLKELMKQIDIIDNLQSKYSNDLAVLKSKIIDAGIQGKLTEQLPEDGDAEDLYAQILNQKSQLIKEGKIKKEKPLPDIAADEIPFEIPKNWKWVRFGNLMWNRDSERIPVSVADRKKLAKTYDYYGASGVIDKVEEYLFDEKLLLIGEDGANLLSRSTPIAFLADGKYWVNNHAHVLGYYKYDYLDFVMYYINSISLVPYVTGAAQPKLNQENMNKIPVPLPPYLEQKRIVEKIQDVLEQLT
ncbi:MAG: restriction endonuclease subunit S [Lachnospiraceae bacterium]|nr:restriction endonuclease subunit S [Lachnospiraceae bacterium]